MRASPLADCACSPIPDPEKIICLGLNYRDHAEEAHQEIPNAPMWFAKFANSLVGHGADVVLPDAHPDYVDYEAELAVVIGRTAKRVSEERRAQPRGGRDGIQRRQRARPPAPEPAVDERQGGRHVRALRARAGHAGRGRRPPGARAAHADQRRGPSGGDHGEHDLRCRDDGRLALAHDDPLPGDIIATGTPAGIGAVQGRFLRDGDTVEVEIDRVGVVGNRAERGMTDREPPVPTSGHRPRA